MLRYQVNTWHVRIVAEHNQAELSKLEIQTANRIYPWSVWRGYRDDSTEVRAVIPAATRLDESSGKTLDADHDNQAELNKLEAQAANRV